MANDWNAFLAAEYHLFFTCTRYHLTILGKTIEQNPSVLRIHLWSFFATDCSSTCLCGCVCVFSKGKTKLTAEYVAKDVSCYQARRPVCLLSPCCNSPSSSYTMGPASLCDSEKMGWSLYKSDLSTTSSNTNPPSCSYPQIDWIEPWSADLLFQSADDWLMWDKGLAF